MKKIINVLLSILILFTVFSIRGSSDNNDLNEISVTYHFKKPFINYINIENENYAKISMEDVNCFGNPGEPLIPIKGARILIPQYYEVYDIILKTSNKLEIEIENQIIPVGKIITKLDKEEKNLLEKNKNIYDSDEVFPKELFEKVGCYNFRGYKILVLNLYPLQYKPISGEILYFNKIDITLKLKEKNIINDLFRYNIKDRQEVLKKIDNPTVLSTYEKEKYQTQKSDNYELLIITTEELKESFIPLKEAHNKMGTITKIKTLNDISFFPEGRTSENIRDFIKNEYINNGIDYVLLGGDKDIIPVKMLWVKGLDEDIWPVEDYMPSDLYYSCLDGVFNYDKDNKWGEPTDGDDGKDVDLVAEVFVGRACIDNNDDANNFVTKTVEYINTNLNDQYLNNILLAGEHLGDYGIASWGGNYLDLLIDESYVDGYHTKGIPSEEYEIEKLYERDEPNNNWGKEEIIQRINNEVHIINHDGHSYYGYNMKMFNPDIEYLSNQKPFFVYSVGCMSGGFDDPDGYDCFAEHLTVKTENGAFAAIMNARYGFFWSYSTDGDGTRFNREFWDAVYGEKNPIIGKANQDSKEDNLHLITRSCMRWTYYELNLFGDPSIAFHVSKPPIKPTTPNGKKTGQSGLEYTYSSVTSDPDGDNVYYYFDWGDGSNSGWFGPFESGEQCSRSHKWKEKGNYKIRIKAKDINGIEGEWSDPLVVNMPKNNRIVNKLFIIINYILIYF